MKIPQVVTLSTPQLLAEYSSGRISMCSLPPPTLFVGLFLLLTLHGSVLSAQERPFLPVAREELSLESGIFISPRGLQIDEKNLLDQLPKTDQLFGLFKGETDADEVVFVALCIQQLYLEWQSGPESFSELVKLPLWLDSRPSEHECFAYWYIRHKHMALSLAHHIKKSPQLAELIPAMDACLGRLAAVEKYLATLEIIREDRVNETWAGVAGQLASDAANSLGEAFLRRLSSTVSPATSKEEAALRTLLGLAIASAEAADAAWRSSDRANARIRAARGEMDRSITEWTRKAEELWLALRKRRPVPFALHTQGLSGVKLFELAKGAQRANPVLDEDLHGLNSYRFSSYEPFRSANETRFDPSGELQEIIALLKSIPKGPSYSSWRESLMVRFVEIEGYILDQLLAQQNQAATPSYGGARPDFIVRLAKDSLNAGEAAAKDSHLVQVMLRNQYCHALAAAGHYADSIVHFRNLAEICKNWPKTERDSIRDYRHARVLALLGRTPEACDLLTKLSPEFHAEIVRDIALCPDFTQLKSEAAGRFRELTEVKFSWSFAPGFFHDSVTVTNESRFEIRSIEVRLNLFSSKANSASSGGEVKTLQWFRLSPNESYTWKLRGKSAFEKRDLAFGDAEISCRQGTAQASFGR